MEDKLLDPEIERLTELYEKDPTSRVFAPLADSYRKSGLYDEAVDILKKGLEFHPDYVSAHLVLGRCYHEKNMLQLAKASFEKVLELDQQNIIALRLLGDILHSMDDRKGALSRYHQVLAIDPANSEIQELISRIGPVPDEHRADPQPIEPSALTTLGSSISENQVDEPGPTPIEESGAIRAAEEGPRLTDGDIRLEGRDSADKSFILLTPEEAPSVDDEALEGLRKEAKGFATVTLAEIYEGQGFLEKALDVYKQLLEKRPDDERIAERIENLSARLQPAPDRTIEKAEGSFSNLFEDRQPEGEQSEPRQTAQKTEEETEEKEQSTKGNFSAFKQWLEGLSKNEESS